MDIAEKLAHAMHSKNFEISVFGNKVIISDSILVMWFIMIIMIIGAYVIGKRLKAVPETKIQSFMEMLVGGINSFVKDIIGHHWIKFAPFLATIFIFLVLSNIISVFSIIPSGEQLYHITGIEFFERLPLVTLKPPTKNINVTFALSVCAVLYSIWAAVSIKGVKGWVKGLATPSFIMLPMNIMEIGIRSFSLSIRLFGNILCAFAIMETVYILVPIILPAGLSLYFDFFDGILQAFIFSFLTTIYIYEAVE